jgi:TetR/AcrR family transcriptional regulator, acrAB operon repressor
MYVYYSASANVVNYCVGLLEAELLRRTKEEAEITRQTIIEAALVLFSEQGVSQTSLVEIATQAKVTRGAVYWHFKNKWDLFDAILSRYDARIEQLSGAGQEELESDPLGRLSDLLHFIFVNVSTREDFRNIFKIFLHEQFLRDREDVPAKIREFVDKALTDKINTLENAKRKGQLPADLDTQAGSQMIHTMVEGVVQSWLREPQAFNLAQEAPRYVESIFAILKHSLKCTTSD